ncbi:hypothetical protein DRN82_08040, partial [Thermococci archaeon]
MSEYKFIRWFEDLRKTDVPLVGGKGANLAEMSGLGIPVPAGLTITTEVCTHYYDNDHNYPEELKKQV